MVDMPISSELRHFTAHLKRRILIFVRINCRVWNCLVECLYANAELRYERRTAKPKSPIATYQYELLSSSNSSASPFNTDICPSMDATNVNNA